MHRAAATSRSIVMFLSLSMGVLGGLPAAQAADLHGRAGEYYENAIKRYNAQDHDGAIIQLKNALQQDSKRIAAMILMGEVYVAAGHGAAAETALREAPAAGADVTLTADPDGQSPAPAIQGAPAAGATRARRVADVEASCVVGTHSGRRDGDL